MTPQAGQNEEALAITQADAGTQTEEETETDQLQEEEQEQVIAKLFGLDEREESDSAADDSGWQMMMRMMTFFCESWECQKTDGSKFTFSL